MVNTAPTCPSQIATSSRTPLSDKISRYTLEGCDWKGLLELIDRIRKRVTRELGPSVEMISCYEASYDGFWLHRLLEGHGVRNYVIDPASSPGACPSDDQGDRDCRGREM
jgi:hypothetical protein